jgi:hypothetical protein
MLPMRGALKEVVRRLSDRQWEQIESLTMAYMISNEHIDVSQAEIYALLAVVDQAAADVVLH